MDSKLVLIGMMMVLPLVLLLKPAVRPSLYEARWYPCREGGSTATAVCRTSTTVKRGRYPSGFT